MQIIYLKRINQMILLFLVPFQNNLKIRKVLFLLLLIIVLFLNRRNFLLRLSHRSISYLLVLNFQTSVTTLTT